MKKNLFISWSGDRSKRVAKALYDWIPTVIQSVGTWMSDEDIQKGTVGLPQIAQMLNDSDFGIICLTPENQHKPWILFESGAISKRHEIARAFTFLLSMKFADVTGPLGSLQHTDSASREDVLRLVKAINLIAEEPLEEGRLTMAFGSLWPQLDNLLTEIRETTTDGEPKTRDTRDMLEELVEGMRFIVSHTTHYYGLGPRTTTDLPPIVAVSLTAETNLQDFIDHLQLAYPTTKFRTRLLNDGKTGVYFDGPSPTLELLYRAVNRAGGKIGSVSHDPTRTYAVEPSPLS